MQELNLPKYKFRFEKRNNQNFIFDAIRKKFILCTPEEWVRQHLIQFFIQEKVVPAGLISVEKEVHINGLSKRYDALIADKQGKPIVLIECKAPSIKISQAVFQQIAEYNLHFHVPYLFVSNGLSHYICKIEGNNTMKFLKVMPNYSDL
ncbi:MAG: type I restriction enzyme HsdR N-terminal domain-containing protein [Bacteroidales bacterium]|jgi:type I site-specific restriction endonuclease|nr:type I restriction enzyme HsdR N-terminal domain-containing protein [Bacteroidales bacterium]